LIQYQCKKCGITTDISICPICGERTELVSTAIFWCPECNVPTWTPECPVCKSKAKRIASDLRPVFPEERLLLEILIGEPLKYLKDSVWCSSAQVYYVNGEKISFAMAQAIKNCDIEKVRAQLEEFKDQNTAEYFEQWIKAFIKANSLRYDYIVSEAIEYLQKISIGFDVGSMFVSFSGGKDSTVTSDLVLRAFPGEPVLHIYGDTTLEFPETKEYVTRFKKAHPKLPVITAKNTTKEFGTLCEQLGPPSRVMRWCCTVFKTGAIQRKITALFKNKSKILTFYGIRRNESTSRSKYDRDTQGAKITKQMTASPIIDWLDYDIWLYLLTTGIDFNEAYRVGYQRVGCWCCPNNSGLSEQMSRIYMPEEYTKWHSFLVDFAKKMGKPDPEVYVDDGKWKARQGGNGLEYSSTTVLSFTPCVLQENTLNFELQKPITEDLYELFKPFGYINKELGNERLGEVYILGKDGSMKLKLQGRIGTTTLKVSILDKNFNGAKSILAGEDKIKAQITKYQMCIGCLACESVCKMNAISIETDREGMRSYKINDDRCVRCGECVNHFDGGCYLKKVMRTQNKKG